MYFKNKTLQTFYISMWEIFALETTWNMNDTCIWIWNGEAKGYSLLDQWKEYSWKPIFLVSLMAMRAKMVVPRTNATSSMALITFNWDTVCPVFLTTMAVFMLVWISSFYLHVSLNMHAGGLL